jgi:hypothetical protein
MYTKAVQLRAYLLSPDFFFCLLALIQCTMDQIFFVSDFIQMVIERRKALTKHPSFFAFSGDQHVLRMHTSVLIIIIII